MSRAECPKCSQEIRPDPESHTGWSHLSGLPSDSHLSRLDMDKVFEDTKDDELERIKREFLEEMERG